MLLQIYKICCIAFLFLLLFLSSSIQAQILDTNKIDTAQKIELVDTTWQNNSQELDSLNINQVRSELSFYKEHIEPIIAVATAALLTILLFSIRSKK
jgi:hypothetical protein